MVGASATAAHACRSNRDGNGLFTRAIHFRAGAGSWSVMAETGGNLNRNDTDVDNNNNYY